MTVGVRAPRQRRVTLEPPLRPNAVKPPRVGPHECRGTSNPPESVKWRTNVRPPSGRNVKLAEPHLREPRAGQNGLAVRAPLVVRPSNRTNGNPLGGLGSVKSAAPRRPASGGSVKPGVAHGPRQMPSKLQDRQGPHYPPLNVDETQTALSADSCTAYSCTRGAHHASQNETSINRFHR